MDEGRLDILGRGFVIGGFGREGAEVGFAPDLDRHGIATLDLESVKAKIRSWCKPTDDECSWAPY